MTEKERIERIILDEGLTSGQFAVEIGIQNSTLSHILNGRNNPSLDVIKKILNRFPNISSDWLISGVGPIYREIKHSQAHTLFDSVNTTDLKSQSYAENSFPDSNTISETKEIENVKIPESQDSTKQIIPETAQKVGISHNLIPEQQSTTPIPERKVQKIILYYSDHTFQEFESK
jgi:transcriptional regulator with XRE-family HTH domain